MVTMSWGSRESVGGVEDVVGGLSALGGWGMVALGLGVWGFAAFGLVNCL